ncbi:MAG: DUF928 domain-containing protein [Elainellaceae cyanobacterium]
MKPLASSQTMAFVLAAMTSTAVLIATATAAIAQFNDPAPGAPNDTIPFVSRAIEYVPPEGADSPGQTGSLITRSGGSCAPTSTAGMVPLAPQTHIGQSSSQQPTLAWFTPESGPRTIEFSLAKQLPDGRFELVYKTELSAADRGPSGITTLSLSETDVSLTPNTNYTWQAVLVCNPNRPSQSVVIRSDVAVIEAPNALKENLAAAADSAAERVSLYAGSGLWYDAFNEALVAEGNSSSGSLQVALLESLVDLEAAALEANEPAEEASATIFPDRLQQVIDAIR